MDIQNIWIITDTHFRHHRMLELCHRPEDYNEKIIQHWRENVQPDDLVIHLSSDRQIVSKALATAAGYAFCECDNLSNRSSHILMEFDAPNNCIPDIDSKRFRDAVRAYLDIYGADNFNSLINGDAFAEVSGNE